MKKKKSTGKYIEELEDKYFGENGTIQREEYNKEIESQLTKTLDECLEEIFKTVKPSPNIWWKVWKNRFKNGNLSKATKEKIVAEYGYIKVAEAKEAQYKLKT